MKERLFEIIKRNELTAWRFAELLEVQPSSISHILSGRNKPSFDFIEKILTRFPEVSPDWLILGQGEMIRSGYNDELKIHEIDSKHEPTLFDLTSDEDRDTSEITDVKASDIKDISDYIDGSITNVTIGKSSNIDNNNQEYSHITTNATKDAIERVMIFYTNGTFTIYIPK